jgi:hypothetical protein
MKIPEEIIAVFDKEAESLKFGKISLGLIVRGSHIHYEIDKHITFVQDKNQETENIDKNI